jgi:hypothetical protein
VQEELIGARSADPHAANRGRANAAKGGGAKASVPPPHVCGAARRAAHFRSPNVALGALSFALADAVAATQEPAPVADAVDTLDTTDTDATDAP